MEKWFKYNFVCPYCDSLIEYTTKDLGTNLEQCPICPNNLTLMSVVDATIYSPTKKEEEMNLTETPAQTITLTWSENDVETSTTYSPNDVRALVYRDKSYARTMNEYYSKESQLRTLLEEVYADSNEQDTLAQIAEIFDVPLTKEIEVTAWVRVDMTIEVDMAEGDYDIETMVSNNLTVDSYSSEISVSNHEVERVEEGGY